MKFHIGVYARKICHSYRFVRTSSDCSYFLTFQNEQLYLSSKKEEALNSSSGDSLKYSNKGRKACVGRHYLSVSKGGCQMMCVKTQPCLQVL